MVLSSDSSQVDQSIQESTNILSLARGVLHSLETEWAIRNIIFDTLRSGRKTGQVIYSEDRTFLHTVLEAYPGLPKDETPTSLSSLPSKEDILGLQMKGNINDKLLGFILAFERQRIQSDEASALWPLCRRSDTLPSSLSNEVLRPFIMTESKAKVKWDHSIKYSSVASRFKIVFEVSGYG